jgi:hypothetical protein
MTGRILLLSLSLAACADRAPEPPAQPPAPAAPAASGWRINPSGATLATRGDTLVVTTGAHAVAWDGSAPALQPPYVVRARLEKRAGRLHEAIGLIFGGSGLDGAESGQVYSYFLVRGDGSFLVKKRQGAATPVVRDWTRHPVIRRDAQGVGRANDLEVAVTDSLVLFRVNGTEVARVPAADLSVRGIAGVRASHDVELLVTAFQAGAQ